MTLLSLYILFLASTVVGICELTPELDYTYSGINDNGDSLIIPTTSGICKSHYFAY